MVREIGLTQGKVAIVDDEDYKWLNQYRWYASHEKRSKNRDLFYAYSKFKGESSVPMHREILGVKKGQIVDHIDGDGLNNQKHNLRLVSQRQNCQNKHIKKSSKYPGVCWNSRTKKWISGIRINQIKKQLGVFKTEKEAFEAYKKAVHEYTGEKVICEV